ncbi:hypothetical protein Pelo_4148 [Pelomyxa schiedti]|nr:hypothetical protein Pelo_4148 [Pelomyxa schiedti]
MWVDDIGWRQSVDVQEHLPLPTGHALLPSGGIHGTLNVERPYDNAGGRPNGAGSEPNAAAAVAARDTNVKKEKADDREPQDAGLGSDAAYSQWNREDGGADTGGSAAVQLQLPSRETEAEMELEIKSVGANASTSDRDRDRDRDRDTRYEERRGMENGGEVEDPGRGEDSLVCGEGQEGPNVAKGEDMGSSSSSSSSSPSAGTQCTEAVSRTGGGSGSDSGGRLARFSQEGEAKQGGPVGTTEELPIQVVKRESNRKRDRAGQIKGVKEIKIEPEKNGKATKKDAKKHPKRNRPNRRLRYEKKKKIPSLALATPFKIPVPSQRRIAIKLPSKKKNNNKTEQEVPGDIPMLQPNAVLQDVYFKFSNQSWGNNKVGREIHSLQNKLLTTLVHERASWSTPPSEEPQVRGPKRKIRKIASGDVSERRGFRSAEGIIKATLQELSGIHSQMKMTQIADTMMESRVNIFDLPHAVMMEIFRMVPCHETKKLSLVCHQFQLLEKAVDPLIQARVEKDKSILVKVEGLNEGANTRSCTVPITADTSMDIKVTWGGRFHIALSVNYVSPTPTFRSFMVTCSAMPNGRPHTTSKVRCFEGWKTIYSLGGHRKEPLPPRLTFKITETTENTKSDQKQGNDRGP